MIFVFDNEMLAQIIYSGYKVGEISCPTKYFKEASSINPWDSTVYGVGVLKTSLKFRLQKWGLANFRIFRKQEEEASRDYYERID